MNLEAYKEAFKKWYGVSVQEALDAVNSTQDRSRSVWRRWMGWLLIALCVVGTLYIGAKVMKFIL